MPRHVQQNSDESTPHSIVVGAGFGGLTSAILLANAGHRVILIEQGDQVGGRARTFVNGTFYWDAGPTVITAPHMFAELFDLAPAVGRPQFIALDPFYKVFGANGETLNYWKDAESLIREAGLHDAESTIGTRKLLRRISELFEAFFPYTEKPMHNFRSMIAMLPFMVRHGAARGMRSLVRSYVKDPFLQAALGFHPLLVGGDPKRTPALYALIAEFERRWGVHYASGGTSAVVRSLEAVFRQLGGEIRLNTRVDAFLVADKAVAGVRVDSGEEFPADIVVSNIDPLVTQNLLENNTKIATLRRLVLAARLRCARPSMSLHVFYFGTDRRWETDLAHHSILLGAHPDQSIDNVFRKRSGKDVGRFLYVHLPTKTDPKAAPEGCDSFYVLVAAPALRRGHAGEDSDAVRSDVLGRLDGFLPGIKNHIVAEKYVGPSYFRDTLGTPFGAAFSLQPTLLQSAWFRPHNRLRHTRGIYFVGAGTHPGAGVPAVLSSAHITVNLIAEDLRNGKLRIRTNERRSAT